MTVRIEKEFILLLLTYKLHLVMLLLSCGLKWALSLRNIYLFMSLLIGIEGKFSLKVPKKKNQEKFASNTFDQIKE